MKCRVPGCGKTIPKWRKDKGIKSCSKKCSNAWNWIPQKKREEIRGIKYNRRENEKSC